MSTTRPEWERLADDLLSGVPSDIYGRRWVQDAIIVMSMLRATAPAAQPDTQARELLREARVHVEAQMDNFAFYRRTDGYQEKAKSANDLLRCIDALLGGTKP